MKRRHLVRYATACALAAAASRGALARPAAPESKRLGVLTRTRLEHPAVARWWLLALSRLRQRGWSLGHNLAVEIRVGSDAATLQRAAQDLAGQAIDVLYADGNIAALQATRTRGDLPIVMQGAGLVELGLADSLARPGGRVTGIDLLAYDSSGKGLSHLRALRPGLDHIGLPLTRGSLIGEAFYRSWERVASSVGVRITALPRVLQRADVGPMLAAATRAGIQALVTPNLPFLDAADWALVQDWAVTRRAVTLGAIIDRDEVMLAFGASMTEMVDLAVHQLDQVLRGTPPAQLPVMQPTRFDLVINRRLANEAGWRVPPDLLLQATELTPQS